MRFHLDGIAVWVVCLAVIASAPISLWRRLFVPCLMAKARVGRR